MVVTINGIDVNERVPTVPSLALLPITGDIGDLYLVEDILQLRVWDVGTGTWVEPISTALPQWVEDEFIAIALQTVFTLSGTPADPETFELTVNGVQYDDVDDYTLVGNVITWLDTPFTLSAGDEVICRYIKS